MEEVKALIRKYMEYHFEKTKWPFVSKMIIKVQFPEHTEEALRSLQSEGIIYQRKSVNNLLVQYIDTEEKREKVRLHFIKINK